MDGPATDRSVAELRVRTEIARARRGPSDAIGARTRGRRSGIAQESRPRRPTASMPPGLSRRPASSKRVLDEAEPESGHPRPGPGVAPAKSQGCRARTGDSRYAERKAGSLTASRSTTRTSEPLDMGNHARPHRLARQSPQGRAHVFLHVVDSRGCGNRAAHGRMRDNELEHELRPGLAVDPARPGGQRVFRETL